MTFTDLVNAVSSSTGLTKTLVKTMLLVTIREIQGELKTGGEVRLSKFGSFYVAKFNPRTLFGKGQSKPFTVVRFRERRKSNDKRQRP